MPKNVKAKLTASDKKTLAALARASKGLERYDELVRIALLASIEEPRRYPATNMGSPLKLVIGSSR